jgi:hypothetical protein
MRVGRLWSQDDVLQLSTMQAVARRLTKERPVQTLSANGSRPVRCSMVPSPVDSHRHRSHLVGAFFAVNENMVASRVDRIDTEEIKSVCLSGNGSTHGSESGGLVRVWPMMCISLMSVFDEEGHLEVGLAKSRWSNWKGRIEFSASSQSWPFS